MPSPKSGRNAVGMRVVLDSSVLVAAFRSGEPFGREAFAILEAMEQGRCTAVIPITVPVELVAAIRRRTGSSRLAGTVADRLLAMPAFTVTDLHRFRLFALLELARRAERYVNVMPIVTLVRRLASRHD